MTSTAVLTNLYSGNLTARHEETLKSTVPQLRVTIKLIMKLRWLIFCLGGSGAGMTHRMTYCYVKARCFGNTAENLLRLLKTKTKKDR